MADERADERDMLNAIASGLRSLLVVTAYQVRAGIVTVPGAAFVFTPAVVVATVPKSEVKVAHVVLSGTGCQIVKLGDVRKQVSALRIALQAIEDDAALAEIIGREQDVAHATEGRAVRRGDDAGRGRVVPVLAEGSGSRDGVVAPAAPHGRRRP